MNTKFVKGLLACALVAAPLTGCSSGSGDDAAEDKTITIGASVTPVSYTHLDVYKRQRSSCRG